MKKADVQAIIRVFKRTPTSKNVLVFSPAWDANADGCSERAALELIWPAVEIRECDKGQWNLDHTMPTNVSACDVGLICNTFMCSRDPALWLQHISAAVSILVVQDLAISSRADGSNCSVETGDVARYSVASYGIIGRTDPGLKVFDFSNCGFEVIDAEQYEDEGALKFVAVLRLR